MTVSRRARKAGTRIEFADLGDWGASELRSEYDPARRAIRINTRCMEKLRGRRRRTFIVSAIAHELYHHLECISAMPRKRDRIARESAADAFVRILVPGVGARRREAPERVTRDGAS